MNRLTIALAQLNPLVGDIPGNAEQIVAALRAANGAAVGLIMVRACKCSLALSYRLCWTRHHRRELS